MTLFARDRIDIVLRRDFIIESKSIRYDKDRTFYDIPDIVICLSNGRVASLNEHMDSITVPLNGPSVPPGYYVDSPCFSDDPSYAGDTTMTVLKMKNDTFQLPESHSLALEIKLETNSTVRTL